MSRRTVRQTLFAAPFVLTIAAGCGGSSGAPPQEPHVNPPGPVADEGAWQVRDGETVFVYENRDEIHVGVDGLCRRVDFVECPSDPTTGEAPTCNPPPPQQVPCPPGRPASAP